MTRIMLEAMYQNPFDVFIKMLDENLKKKIPQNIPQKKHIFLPKIPPPNGAFSPCLFSRSIQQGPSVLFTWIH
jgi:hypothetical protein